MKVDLSAKGVTVRLKRVSQLWRLCLSLAKAKPAAPKKEGKILDDEAKQKGE